MRISNQQILAQMLKGLKKDNAQQGVSIEKGQIIKAVVAEVMKDSLLLELPTGQLLRAQNTTGDVYAEGETRSFEVLESETRILVKAFSENDSLEAKLQSFIKGIGESVTTEKVAIAKALVEFGVPLTKENIDDVAKTMKQIDTLKGLIDSGVVKLEELPPKSEIRQLLVMHYSDNGQGGNENAEKLNVLLKDVVESQAPVGGQVQSSESKSEQAAQNSIELESKTASAEQTLKADTGKIVNAEERELVKSDLSLSKSDMTLDKSNVEQTVKSLVNLLSQVDFQKIAFHKGVGMDQSIQNMALLEKLILGKQPIGQQVEELINTLKELPDKTIGKLTGFFQRLSELDIKNEKDVDLLLKELGEILEKDESTKPESARIIKEQVSTLQQSSQYLKDINENLQFYQFPLQIDQSMHTVDFFVKKRNPSQKKNDETTIFISLDTHYLKTVQVLLEYKKQSMEIQFRVDDESVLERLESNAPELEHAVSKVCEIAVKIGFRLKDKTTTMLDVIADVDQNGSTTIDMKV